MPNASGGVQEIYLFIPVQTCFFASEYFQPKKILWPAFWQIDWALSAGAACIECIILNMIVVENC